MNTYLASRRSGKTVSLILKAVETGGVIIVHSEASRDHILHTAELMRVKAPKVIVVGGCSKDGDTEACDLSRCDCG